MPTKKIVSAASKKKSPTSRRKSSLIVPATGFVPELVNPPNGTFYEAPHRVNPAYETEEELKKWLATREKRTLQAFQAAYEGHRRGRRKAS
jgi:hypothetical protein